MSGTPATRYSVRPSASSAMTSSSGPRELLQYLRELGIAPSSSSSSDPDPRISFRDFSRRHAVVWISDGAGDGWFVKGPRADAAEETRRSLEREMAVYELGRLIPSLSSSTPTFIAGDPDRATIVLHPIRPGDSLLQRAFRGGPSLEFARGLGLRLGAVHRETSASALAMGTPSPDPYGPIATALVPSAHLLPPGVRLSEALDLLHRLTEEREPVCLVHGDLSWEECLVDGEGDLRLIDWESAGFGDPAWDVACILEEHVRLAEAGLAHLQGIARSMRAFLDAYLGAVGPSLATEARVDRALRSSGARLLESALALANSTNEIATARRLARRALLLLRSPSSALLSKGGLT